ncbi:MAG: hypothetical protein WBK96_14610 [Candidatus Manganitrophaceae bacterium]
MPSLSLLAFSVALSLMSLGRGFYEIFVVDPVSHTVMRIWSAFDFIPKALAFERAETSAITERAARAWTRRSRWRLPLDFLTYSLHKSSSACRFHAPSFDQGGNPRLQPQPKEIRP